MPVLPAAISSSHRAIIELWTEMGADVRFRSLCVASGLPWDFEAGYEPRWYAGPAPEDVELLFLMAEPGAITPTEALNLLPAINRADWVGRYDLRLQEHYWRANLLELCRNVWQADTEANMRARLGGTCTFWMSLPPGSQTSEVPRAPRVYFLERYLPRLLALFPNAEILAAGAKARDRLRSIGIDCQWCWAFTRPGCNHPKAHESWDTAGKAIAQKLDARLCHPPSRT